MSTPQHPAAPETEGVACICPTDDYCPKCHPRWYAKWIAEGCQCATSAGGHPCGVCVAAGSDTPTAPETETDANGLTEAERDSLPFGPAYYPAVERIVAERVRVVEGERDAAREANGWNEWACKQNQNLYAETLARAESAEQQWVKAEGERDVLAKAMWDVRASFGFDTDGDKKYHSTDYIAVARSFIRDMAEALDDLQKDVSSADQDGWGRGYDVGKREGAESAEAAHEAEKAAHERLRAGVEALADEWAEDYPGPNAACNRTPDEWSTDLRSILGGGEAR